MGDCRAPGSACVLEGKGVCGCVCDGVAVVVAVAEGGGLVPNTENQRLAEFCCKCLFFIQAQVTASRQVRHK